MQKNGCSLGIDVARLWRTGRSVALILQNDRQTKAAMELIGKSLATIRKRMRLTIGIDGQAHDQTQGLPLGDEIGNLGKSRSLGVGGNLGKRSGATSEGVANGNADAFFAKIEGQQGAGLAIRRGQRPPTG